MVATVGYIMASWFIDFLLQNLISVFSSSFSFSFRMLIKSLTAFALLQYFALHGNAHGILKFPAPRKGYFFVSSLSSRF